MEYKVYKMSFNTPVHFGKNSIEDSVETFAADTLFSALCSEAVLEDKEAIDELVSLAKEGKFLLSDAFPYLGDTLFLPKPIHKIHTDLVGDSTVKKAYKKLKYIPSELITDYLSGQLDIFRVPSLDSLGMKSVKVSASIRGEEETKPYRVGSFSFEKGNGLYVIVGYESQETLEVFEKYFERLSFSGIGGRRNSGFGHFTFSYGKMDESLRQRLIPGNGMKMLLSVALPKDQEMEEALFEAEYLLQKRSGFVASTNYAEGFRRKRDLYVFQAGSCFKKTFGGDVFDVSERAGSHSVYRYAIPFFLEVDA